MYVMNKKRCFKELYLLLIFYQTIVYIVHNKNMLLTQ